MKRLMLRYAKDQGVLSGVCLSRPCYEHFLFFLTSWLIYSVVLSVLGPAYRQRIPFVAL